MLHRSIIGFHVKRLRQALFCCEVISGIIANMATDPE
jgi:hypothetical protein